jgi:hypothetical protein
MQAKGSVRVMNLGFCRRKQKNEKNGEKKDRLFHCQGFILRRVEKGTPLELLKNIALRVLL